VLIELADLAWADGRLDEADALAHEGECLGGPGDLVNHVSGPSVRAKVLAARGRFDEAEQLARLSVERSADSDLPHMRAFAWRALAHVLAAAGRCEEAREAYEHELAEHEKLGKSGAVAEVRALLVEL